ncbi:type II toxin-antitoxin system VapC family toxin [aff. Roholtiella sp. LEGE 12411]|uniref:type II toxin-antitoxin system VapC family toxin n=1 Tax=aff. Roholtiella sp. LEGE 12411 TaxID=1828822 RepID=UPI001881A570|nr:type II toxin-antitoxin system VapC family toxin [aff. Roholtiella sp. LEGE 12411]MBE9035589.1 type II toxin-antitoxin system VapC family toxin [aff. Roholtiella sp. LEGE 12411]
MYHSYLLHTNILSDFIRHPRGKIFSKIQEVGEEKICTSIIVACELQFGAEKKNSLKLKERISLTFDMITILSLTPNVDYHYAKIRTYLESQGTPISSNDLLIAAHALNLNLTVVTNNVREFSRIPNLKLENWLKLD